MKYPTTQKLERTPLSTNIRNYTVDELRNIFSRLNPYLLRRWMDHFIKKEEYEVCQVIKEVMADTSI